VSATLAEQLAPIGGLLAVECCGKNVGFTNPRPFTREAATRFEAIRQGHVTGDDPFGNGWTADPEAQALLSDPAAHGPPDDGQRLPFTCLRCGASFVWAGGIPQRVPKEVV